MQNAFLDMWDMVVRAVGDLEAVIGFQVGNSFQSFHNLLRLSPDDERDPPRIH